MLVIYGYSKEHNILRHNQLYIYGHGVWVEKGLESFFPRPTTYWGKGSWGNSFPESPEMRLPPPGKRSLETRADDRDLGYGADHHGEVSVALTSFFHVFIHSFIKCLIENLSSFIPGKIPHPQSWLPCWTTPERVRTDPPRQVNSVHACLAEVGHPLPSPCLSFPGIPQKGVDASLQHGIWHS